MRNSIFAWSILFGFNLLIASPWAKALPHRKALDHKSNQYLSRGVFIGGRSGRGFSLLDLRRNYDKAAQAERVVFDWGDVNGAPLMGSIGFFHVGIDDKNQRVVVELSQVVRAGINEAEIQKRFKASPVVKKAQLIFDPVGSATQLILDFKKKVAVESFYLTDDKLVSRLVLDIRPVSK